MTKHLAYQDGGSASVDWSFPTFRCDVADASAASSSTRPHVNGLSADDIEDLRATAHGKNLLARMTGSGGHSRALLRGGPAVQDDDALQRRDYFQRSRQPRSRAARKADQARRSGLELFPARLRRAWHPRCSLLHLRRLEGSKSCGKWWWQASGQLYHALHKRRQA